MPCTACPSTSTWTKMALFLSLLPMSIQTTDRIPTVLRSHASNYTIITWRHSSLSQLPTFKKLCATTTNRRSNFMSAKTRWSHTSTRRSRNWRPFTSSTYRWQNTNRWQGSWIRSISGCTTLTHPLSKKRSTTSQITSVTSSSQSTCESDIRKSTTRLWLSRTPKWTSSSRHSNSHNNKSQCLTNSASGHSARCIAWRNTSVGQKRDSRSIRNLKSMTHRRVTLTGWWWR